ncbi:hypothetical protein FOA43_004006 [Brettanomyces nanus]|uniref:DNA-(apurinic or apyrimidinic site) lyase n=1 Tax=Eeniella nana TaxID=13502 RepID=A0A875SCX9_EENNA|nr:uncharacterized protein FOA43_004006 [Brettanomyces nanus]QPG76614.1 hypothetical protein FOA43_004006 [Brettanomyces nanus]
MAIKWSSVQISPSELSLSKVLRCGQTFRWKCIDQIWSCSFNDRIILLKQNDGNLSYSSIPFKEDTIKLIHQYFHLDIDVNRLYKDWCSRDARFLKNSSRFQGIRILDQDPWENLVCFICSSNNNVKRISKMCESLCVNYGQYIATFQGVKHYSFPLPEPLAGNNIENELRDLGFGYRAKFINKTAQMMLDDPDIYYLLVSGKLRDKTSIECQQFLLQFPGVGPKVADCVALMSLNKHQVVPIDTHFYQIAKRDYRFHSKSKSKTMTKIVYDEIQQFFLDLWGSYAGWAHSLLFAADLTDLENGINRKRISPEADRPKRRRKSP